MSMTDREIVKGLRDGGFPEPLITIRTIKGSGTAVGDGYDFQTTYQGRPGATSGFASSRLFADDRLCTPLPHASLMACCPGR